MRIRVGASAFSPRLFGPALPPARARKDALPPSGETRSAGRARCFMPLASAPGVEIERRDRAQTFRQRRIRLRQSERIADNLLLALVEFFGDRLQGRDLALAQQSLSREFAFAGLPPARATGSPSNRFSMSCLSKNSRISLNSFGSLTDPAIAVNAANVSAGGATLAS